MSVPSRRVSFVLQAPLRSPLNMHSHALRREPTALRQLLARRARGCGVPIWQPEDRDTGALRYASLSDEDVPEPVKPLLVITPSLERSAGELEAIDAIAAGARLVSLEVAVFDNTLAVATARVELELQGTLESLLDGLDQRATAAMTAVATQVVDAHLLPAYAALVSEDEIVRAPSDNRAFHDITAHYDLGPGVARTAAVVLWVSRTLFLGDVDGDDCRALAGWTQRDDLTALEPGGIRFNVGNVVVAREWSAADRVLAQVGRAAQYQYALFDVLNRNLQSLMTRPQPGRGELSQAAQDTDRIARLVVLCTLDLADLRRGLQGRRAELFEGLTGAWNLSQLVHDVTARKDAVRDFLQDAMQAQAVRYNRVVETVLFLIGAVALVDFSVNLSAFSSDGRVMDSIPGPVDLARAIPPDAFFDAALLLVALATFLFIRRPS